MGTDRDEVAVAEAMDWLQRQARGDGHPRPTVAASTAAGYARELLHELERLAAVEMLGTPAGDEVARLRAVEQRAREALADRPAAASVDPPWESVHHAARYILTGEADV